MGTEMLSKPKADIPSNTVAIAAIVILFSIKLSGEKILNITRHTIKENPNIAKLPSKLF